MTTVILRPASRKRRAPLDRYPQLPVPLSSVTGLPASNAKWSYYRGCLHGNTVIVEDSEHVESLYYMGFFGKCTISRRNPEFISQPSIKFTQASEYVCPVIEQRRYDRRKKWKDSCEKGEQEHDDDEDSNEETDEQKTILICDTASEEDDKEAEKEFAERKKPVLQSDPYPINEFLHLNLFEAFYLSYALGCLVIENDKKEKLDIVSLWEHCCKSDSLFVPTYVCYHYFRSKGWVVRPGLKLGTDFCLYKDGPPYFHSSYSVLVLPVMESLTPDSLFPTQSLTWTSVIGLSRIVEHTVKETVLCYVVRPEEVGMDEMKLPSCISKFQVQEILLRRWVSSQERELDED